MDQPKPRISRIPLNAPTLRATNIFVTFDGGSFVMSAQDLRATEPWDASGQATVLGSFEVSRIAFSAATFVWLKQQMETAEKAYRDAMKIELPDPKKIVDSLKAAAAIEQITKPPEQSGPTELS
jgi:hypothetical protein